MAADQEQFDYSEPIKITEDIHWVGFYDEEAAFHCNPYILKDGDEVIIFDPASVTEFPKVASKIFSLIDPSQISYIVLHHQDPDLCAAVPMFEDIIKNENLKIVTHSRASVLIRYYGVKSPFYCVDQNDYSLTLKSGRCLRFMVTPFAHFPSSIVTYDEKNKALFSSDIFGAISREWSLFAKPGYEEQMAAFHKGYMPSHYILRPCIEKLSRLELKMILPQHGSIIKADMIDRCMEFLKELKCGIDLAESDKELYGWVPE